MSSRFSHQKVEAKVPDFIPPRNNRFVEWLGRVSLPFILWWNNYEGIRISQTDVERLRSLSGSRTVICSNHSHRHDAIFLFSLSAILKEQFNYIAAREIFDWWPFDFHGWCIQHVGAYSITRGAVDRQSMAMSRRVIVAGKRKLVVFPECEISGGDDRLLPIEPALAGLFYKSLEEVQKIAPGEAVHILPVALKYKYVEDISGALSNSLTRIENALNIEKQRDSLPERLEAAVQAFVATLAAEFRLGHANWANTEHKTDFDSIINGLINHIAEGTANPIEVNEPRHTVHLLRRNIHEFLRIKENFSPYRRALHAERTRYMTQFYKLFETILRIAALKEFRATSGMSQENLANAIDLIEREMFGKATQKGQRMVYMTVGNPINLFDRYDSYRRNRRGEVDWLTQEIERQLLDMLGISIEKKEVA